MIIDLIIYFKGRSSNFLYPLRRLAFNKGKQMATADAQFHFGNTGPPLPLQAKLGRLALPFVFLGNVQCAEVLFDVGINTAPL